MQGFKWSIQNLQCSTFLSWGSICFQLLAFNWWSSSNFILIFSMDNCSISQNPAKSWEVGRGCALGFCATEEKNMLALVLLEVKHLCKWSQISLARQFEQTKALGKAQREEQSKAILTGGFYCKESVQRWAALPCQHPLTKDSRYPPHTTGKGPLWQDLPRDAPGHNWWQSHLHWNELPASSSLAWGKIPHHAHTCRKEWYLCKCTFPACANSDIPTCEHFFCTLRM